MKILFIANSFGEDATRHLEAIAEGELFVRNLYIGGCSLKMHAENIRSGAAAYQYQKDAVMLDMASVKDALLREEWDFISVQQVSNESGLIDSYEPYLKELIDFIREYRPLARIVFHRTWSYDVGSHHPCFPTYNCDSAYMDEMIERTAEEISKRYSLPVIPSGVAVMRARALPEFAVGDGEASLTRDTFHLSECYGRYLAGLVAYRFFTGKSALGVKYIPEGCEPGLARKLQEIADGVEYKREL